MTSWVSVSDLLYTFGKYKQVYHFHPVVYQMLADTGKDGFTPDVFQNLPFPAFYLDLTGCDTWEEIDGENKKIIGMFVKIEKLWGKWVVNTAYVQEGSNVYWTRDIYKNGGQLPTT